MKKISAILLSLLLILLLSACNKQPSATSCADGAHKLECVASVENHKYKCMRDGCDYEEAAMPHIFEDSANCVDCGIDNETVTLEFTLAEDGKSYIVSGIGSCKLKHINIPSTYRGLPVTEIGDNAFSAKKIESVTLPKGVLQIGKSAFSYCSALTSVTLPEGLLRISDSAFTATEITEIVIPNSVTVIGDQAFAECSALTRVNIPNGVKELKSTFLACSSLAEILLPEGLEVLEGTFTATPLTHIDIPNSVHTIDRAFNLSNLESVNFGTGVKAITNISFSDTKIKSITIPESVEVIDEFVFDNCLYLEEVIIENGLTKIGTCSFESCPSLTKVTVPESIEYIEFFVFDNCPNLQYNVYEGMNYLGNGEKPYLVLCGTAGGTRLVAHPDTKIFAEPALFDNEDITEVEIGENVTYIPPMALRGMDSVISATVDANNKAFYSVDNCIISRAEKSLVAVFNCSEIPSDSSIKYLDMSVFSSLQRLKVIYIPRGVEEVYVHFSDCEALEGIIFDIDVKKIVSAGSVGNGSFAAYYLRTYENFRDISIVQNYDPYSMFRPIDQFWNDAKRYIYSEEEPDSKGIFWHWVDGVPTPW